MAKSHIIDLHPNLWERIPLRIGAMRGPRIGPTSKRLIARPRVEESQISATVPAPTAKALADAPPAHVRKTMSIAMFVLIAPRMLKVKFRENDTR
ncbi:hypothetical protein BDV19DRAFT_374364 [Aspergillus venezuelensis]